MLQDIGDSQPQNVYTPVPLRIVWTEDLTEDVRLFKTRFVDDELARSFTYQTGQFSILSMFGIGEAPFSISSSPTRGGILEFGIRKTGMFTDALFKLKENDIIGHRGPLGNGFPVERMEGKNIIFVAGGLGVVPLRSVLTYTLDNRDDYGELFFMYGTRKPKDLLFRDEFFRMEKRNDIDVFLSVEDTAGTNWPYQTGLVTGLFKDLPKLDPEDTYAVICGPPIMYKFVLEKLLEMGMHKHQILMTLERRMRCGVGKCGHCAVDHTYTCIEGPVFTYWDTLHLKELI